MSRNSRRKPEVQQLDDRCVPAAFASVSGTVFADTNGNGTRDTGEPTLGGVTVQLRAASDNTSEAVTQTASDGSFTLSGVSDGSHLVVVSPTGSGPNAADVVKNVLVAGGQSVGPLSVGVQATGTVSGVAYTDVNKNGQRDAGEPVRAGLVLDLALYGQAGNVLTAVTGADGSYVFTGVPDGTHRLTVHTPGLGTTPLTVSVVGGATAAAVNVPVTVAAPTTTTVSGYVRLGGSVADSPGLPGVTVLYDKTGDGQPDAQAVTDANGYYQFTGVPVGTAGGVLRLVGQSSNAGSSQRAALVSATDPTSPGNDFTVVPTGRVVGSAFIDLNGDGKYQAGDTTFVPPTVQLDLFNSGRVVTYPATAQNGAYVITGVPDGTHTLILTAPGGYAATTATRVPVTVANGGPVVAPDIAFRASGGTTVAVGNGAAAGATTYTFSTDPSTGGLTATQGNVTTPLGGSTSSRVVTADVNGDGVDDLITAPGPGAAPIVRIYDGRTGAELVAGGIQVFESGFVGGLNLSAGDFLRTGKAQLVVSADVGGGPRVKVIDPSQWLTGADPTKSKVLADFFGIEDANFRGGTRTAVGDLNGDGTPDLVVAAGQGGGPRVAIFDGRTVGGGADPVRLVGDFFAYEPALRNGATVGVGDVDGNGKNDLIVGAGPGGAPRVTVFAGQGIAAGLGADGPRLADFYVNGDTTSRSGTRLTVKDVDGDGKADVIATNGGRAYVLTGPSILATYLTGQAPVAATVLNPFPETTKGGLFVG